MASKEVECRVCFNRFGLGYLLKGCYAFAQLEHFFSSIFSLSFTDQTQQLRVIRLMLHDMQWNGRSNDDSGDAETDDDDDDDGNSIPSHHVD